jgi:hypothetical protein
LIANFLTSITFADVSKAFDRVWIRGLLLKLERYGIKGDLLMWLKSYLTNRSQRVAIKEQLVDEDLQGDKIDRLMENYSFIKSHPSLIHKNKSL